MSQSQTPEMSYEAAREALGDVVRKLESGGASLNETMELWEEGQRLADVCQQWLDGAKATIDAARAKAVTARAEEDGPAPEQR